MKLGNLFSLFSKKINPRPSIKQKDETERIEEIFGELKDAKAKRIRLERYAAGMKQRKDELQKYEALTEEDHGKVAGFLDQYRNVVEDRKLLEGRLIKNNPALRIIQSREEEIPGMIEEIRETENKQRYTYSDILYLEEEKNYLYEYRENLITGYKALKIVTISLIIILGIICVALLTMVQALRENIFIPSSIISVVTLILGFGILISKRQIEHELSLNELMQQRAIRLLNKTKIRYFHHTNYLHYQYENFSIKNADHLNTQYRRYLKNKNNATYYNNMNKQLIEIEDKVFDLLYEKGIERDAFDNIDEWAEVQNIAILLKNIKQEYESTSKQIEALSSYEEELCKEAFWMTEMSPEIAPRVEALMEGYMELNGGKI